MKRGKHWVQKHKLTKKDIRRLKKEVRQNRRYAATHSLLFVLLMTIEFLFCFSSIFVFIYFLSKAF